MSTEFLSEGSGITRFAGSRGLSFQFECVHQFAGVVRAVELGEPFVALDGSALSEDPRSTTDFLHLLAVGRVAFTADLSLPWRNPADHCRFCPSR